MLHQPVDAPPITSLRTESAGLPKYRRRGLHLAGRAPQCVPLQNAAMASDLRMGRWRRHWSLRPATQYFRNREADGDRRILTSADHDLWGSITESGLVRLPGWDHR